MGEHPPSLVDVGGVWVSAALPSPPPLRVSAVELVGAAIISLLLPDPSASWVLFWVLLPATGGAGSVVASVVASAVASVASSVVAFSVEIFSAELPLASAVSGPMHIGLANVY